MKSEIKRRLKLVLSKEQIEFQRSLALKVRWKILAPFLNIFARIIISPINRVKNSTKENRLLEIGPGPQRIAGFETLNVVWSNNVDYVCNASARLPFKDDTFQLIYASHIIEHLPWYQIESTLKEWVRVLKPNGRLEIWVPNGLLIAKTFVDAEEGVQNNIESDGWYKFNPERDPCIWANGRIFSYGDGTGIKSDPNWHLAVLSPRYLKKLLEDADLYDVHRLERTEVRGHDHGWINLGYGGSKR